MLWNKTSLFFFKIVLFFVNFMLSIKYHHENYYFGFYALLLLIPHKCFERTEDNSINDSINSDFVINMLLSTITVKSYILCYPHFYSFILFWHRNIYSVRSVSKNQQIFLSSKNLVIWSLRTIKQWCFFLCNFTCVVKLY